MLHQLLFSAFDLDWDRDDALTAYDALTATIPTECAAMRGYLAAARPHAFTFLDDTLQRALAPLGGVDLGTGVIERVMRELNARTDIGGSRWSTAGLRDLVTVKTLSSGTRLIDEAYTSAARRSSRPPRVRTVPSTLLRQVVR